MNDFMKFPTSYTATSDGPVGSAMFKLMLQETLKVVIPPRSSGGQGEAQFHSFLLDAYGEAMADRMQLSLKNGVY